jgi:hypothetical protein
MTLVPSLGSVLEKFVNKNRALRRGLHGKTHVMIQLGIGVNDLHGASAQNEGRANQHGIAEPLRGGQSLRFVGGQAIGRLRNVEFGQHSRE